MVLLYAHINKKSNTFFIKIPGKALQAALEAIELRLTTLRCRYTPVGVPTQGDQIGVVMETIPPHRLRWRDPISPPPAAVGPSSTCGAPTFIYRGTLEAKTWVTKVAVPVWRRLLPGFAMDLPGFNLRWGAKRGVSGLISCASDCSEAFSGGNNVFFGVFASFLCVLAAKSCVFMAFLGKKNKAQRSLER